MRVDRNAIAIQLSAGIEDLKSIEARPIDGVKADLKRLGVDPSTSIDLARRLSGQREAPAVRLLERIEKAEDAASEIEALERAGIEDVRAEVPRGRAASVATKARKRSGMPSNVTSLRRSKRRVIGWGGSLIGMAACLALFMVTRPDQLYQVEIWPSQQQESDGVAALSDTASAEETGSKTAGRELGTTGQGTLRSRAERASRTAEAPADDSATARSYTAPPAPPASAPDLAKDLPSVAELRRTIVEALDQDETAVADAEASADGDAERSAKAEAPAAVALSEPPSPARPVPRPAETETFSETLGLIIPAPTSLPDKLVAALIVDSDQAPADLKTALQSLPEDDLADRLADAGQIAGERMIVGLISFVRDDREIDAVVVLSQPGSSSELGIQVQAAAAFAEQRVRGTDSSETGIEIIDLPSDNR